MVWITPPDFGFNMKRSTPAQMQTDQFFKQTSMNSNKPPKEKKNKIQKMQVTNKQKRNTAHNYKKKAKNQLLVCDHNKKVVTESVST